MQSGNRLTEHERKRVVHLVNSGVSIKAIMQRLSVSRQTIYNCMGEVKMSHEDQSSPKK